MQKKISRPFFSLHDKYADQVWSELSGVACPPFFSLPLMFHGGLHSLIRTRRISFHTFPCKFLGWKSMLGVKRLCKNLSEAYIRMHTCMTSAWMSLRPSSVCLCHVFRIQMPLSVIYPRLSLISLWEQTGVSRKNVPASPEKSHRVLRPQIQLPFHRHWSSLRICLAAWGFTSWWHNKNKDSLVPYVSKHHERLDYVHNSWMS